MDYSGIDELADEANEQHPLPSGISQKFQTNHDCDPDREKVNNEEPGK